jgi:hypothetical protein
VIEAKVSVIVRTTVRHWWNTHLRVFDSQLCQAGLAGEGIGDDRCDAVVVHVPERACSRFSLRNTVSPETHKTSMLVSLEKQPLGIDVMRLFKRNLKRERGKVKTSLNEKELESLSATHRFKRLVRLSKASLGMEESWL